MQKRRGWLGSLCAVMMAVAPSAVSAQPAERLPPAPPPAAPKAAPATPAAPAPAPAAPAPAAATPAPVAPAPAAPAPAAASASPAADAAPGALPTFDLCTPACRAGFVCAQGTCVSACNPPCPAGQLCTADAQCVDAAPPAPPSFYTAGAPIEAPPDRSVEAHDGFMLRLTLGFGFAGAARDVRHDVFSTLGGDGETKFSGFGDTFSLDIGASPVDNLVIHGRLASYNMPSPKIKRRGNELGDNSENAVDAVLLGPAVTYYFMPVNLYLTGAIGIGAVGVRISQEDDNSHFGTGFSLNFDVGKEWWVGDQWGLGVAGRFWYTHASAENFEDDDGADADYALVGFAVLFSATYQ